MAKIDGAKRFYDRAEVIDQTGTFTVALDSRAIKTPAAADLVLPTETLADAVAGEWNGQGETLDAATMPMFRMAATVIDRVAPKRAEVIYVTLKFGETDLLCYRADAPDDLVQRQIAGWQPWLDWAAETLKPEQIEYAAADVLYLHRLKEEMDGLLDREGRRDLAEACFRFLPDRAALDVAGWPDEDIFAH